MVAKVGIIDSEQEKRQQNRMFEIQPEQKLFFQRAKATRTRGTLNLLTQQSVGVIIETKPNARRKKHNRSQAKSKQGQVGSGDSLH